MKESSGSVCVCRPAPLGPAGGLTLVSDLHLGSSLLDLDFLEAELWEVHRAGDRLLINGDVLDLILPSDKKRYLPAAIHPRLRGRDDLVGAVLEWAEELLAPHVDRIDLIGCGNHDAQLEKAGSFDPVYELVRRLNLRCTPGHKIAYGGYCGFVEYKFLPPYKQRFVIYYHHGWGAGGSLKQASGDLDRLLAQVEGADLFWLGHRHVKMQTHLQRLRVGPRGVDIREVRFVRTGSYLKPYGGRDSRSMLSSGRRGNYVADGGLPPQGLGGARVQFSPRGPRLEVRVVQ